MNTTERSLLKTHFDVDIQILFDNATPVKNGPVYENLAWLQ